MVEHLAGEAEHRGLGKVSLNEMREKRDGDGRVGQGDPWVPTTGKYLRLCVEEQSRISPSVGHGIPVASYIGHGLQRVPTQFMLGFNGHCSGVNILASYIEAVTAKDCI